MLAASYFIPETETTCAGTASRLLLLPFTNYDYDSDRNDY